MVYTHMLVPTDFAPAATQALVYALAEATQHQARLTLLHVLHHHPPTAVYDITDAPQHGAGSAPEFGARVPALPAHTPETVRRDDDEAARVHLQALVPATCAGPWEVQVTAGPPAEAIVRTAEELDVALIMLATHGRTGVPHLVVGRVAEQVVHHALGPVLTVRQRVRRASGPMDTDTRLAVVQTRPEQGVPITHVDMPGCRPHEVLVRVRATSVCGTDVHLYNWDPWAQARLALPRILGHEAAGEVVAVGADVHGIAVGDLVSAETHIPCG